MKLQNQARVSSFMLVVQIPSRYLSVIVIFCELQKELSKLFYLDILFNHHMLGLWVMQW